MHHKNGTGKLQAILRGDGFLSPKNGKDFVEEVTFQTGSRAGGVQRSINKGAEQKLAGCVQGTERSSVGLDTRQQELEG